MGPMQEFRALEGQEHWSSLINTPELQESYDAIS
jgi:hypothetical protein